MGLLRAGIEMAKAAGRDMAINLVVALIAAGLAVLGAGFLVAAGYLALAAHFGSLNACVLMGAAFLALAALLVAIRFAGGRTPAPLAAPVRPPPPPIEPLAQTAFEIGYGIGRAIFGRRRD